MADYVATKTSTRRHSVLTPTRMFNSYIVRCGRRLVPAFSNADKPLCKSCERAEKSISQ